MARANLSRNQWSTVGLVALGVATAIVAALALVQYRTPPAAATPAPTNTAAPSATVTPSPSASGLAGVAEVISSPDGASILVIGDGSGDQDDEWVAVWARDHLAQNATVSYRVWDRASNEYAAEVRSGSGPTIDLWNASVDSPDMAREPDRIERAWKDADVVLLSYGHRRSPTRVTAQMDAVLAAVREQGESTPVVVLLQNPDRAATEAVQRDSVQAIKTWADSQAFPTVDIFGAFIGDPTRRNDMVESDGSPTPRGSQLWARTLAEALQAS